MLLKTTVQLREVSIILLIVEGDKLGASVFRDVLIMMILTRFLDSVMILSSVYIRFRILSLEMIMMIVPPPPQLQDIYQHSLQMLRTKTFHDQDYLIQLLQQQLLLVIMIPSSVYINLTVQMENHGI